MDKDNLEMASTGQEIAPADPTDIKQAEELTATAMLIEQLKKELKIIVYEEGKVLQNEDLGKVESSRDNAENDKEYFIQPDLPVFVKSTLHNTVMAKSDHNIEMNMAADFRNGKDTLGLLDNLPSGQFNLITNEVDTFASLKKAAILGSHCKIKVVPQSLTELQAIEAISVASDGGFEDDETDQETPDLPKYQMVQQYLDDTFKRNDIKKSMAKAVDDVVVKGTAVIKVKYDERMRLGTSIGAPSGEVL